MTINDLIIEDNVIVKTANEILDEIKDLVSCALSVAKKYLAGATLVTTLISLSQDCVPNSIIIDEALPSIEITTPVTALTSSVNVVEESNARKRLSEELRQMSLLEDGWDNEVAKKPTRLILRNAFLLLFGLDDSILPGCTFFPSNDSGIYLQGRLAKGNLTVFLNDEKMAYIVKGVSGKLSASVNINRKSIEYLNIGLKEYV